MEALEQELKAKSYALEQEEKACARSLHCRGRTGCAHVRNGILNMSNHPRRKIRICVATTHHSFRGSFSAVSTPIFATK